ncbi:MAG: putative transcriptional regulator [Chthonomonadaceae bacterium]|nr:putative transcriptional regulator [Chthonomonadaceae bacterium]
MPPSKIDLITHPVRARLLLAIKGRTLTTQQITTLLSDIPRASLYRHMRELADAGVLTVVKETRVRGTLERTYAVRAEATVLTPQDMAQTSHEEYLRLITSFLGGMTHVYQAYLAEREEGLAEEAFARAIPLYLTTEEFQTLKRQLLDLIAPLEANAPSPVRRRRILSLLGVPDQPDPPPTNNDSETSQSPLEEEPKP